MKKRETACYENYPVNIVIIANLLSIAIYAIGFYILFKLWWVCSVIYLVYCAFLEIKLLSKSCTHCYYYGKCCAFGKGKIAPRLFKKDKKNLAACKTGWKDLFPDLLVSLVPLIAGIALLFIDFSWLILALVIILVLLTTMGNGYVRGQLACKFCKQRELGCPAQKLFNKKRKR
jgi:hypothetical protein